MSEYGDSSESLMSNRAAKLKFEKIGQLKSKMTLKVKVNHSPFSKAALLIQDAQLVQIW